MERGKQLYAAKQYPEAAEAFQQVIAACRCGIPTRATPCLCKDILAGIEKSGDGADAGDGLRAELKKPCICSAKSGRRCENAVHHDAFDSLAATYEKQGRLAQSLACAQQMVNLAPREPKGYLRLGKVLRLQGQPTLAHHAYRGGIALVTKKHPQHPLLRTLQEQETKLKRMVRVDPVVRLPFELVCLIFGQVDFRTLCRCLGVCKAWKSVLTGKEAQELWRIQHYAWDLRSPKHAVSPKTLMRYMFFAGHQVTDLTIDNCVYFGLRSAKLLDIIGARCKQLKHLKLRSGGGTPVVLEDSPTMHFPSLETLYFGLGIKPSAGVLRRIIQAARGSLRELSIFDLKLVEARMYDDFDEWPTLDKLKTIRLANRMGPNTAGGAGTVELAHLMRITPNIETVWLDSLGWALPDSCGDCWQNLQSLFIGEEAGMFSHSVMLPTPPLNFFPPIKPSVIRELHLELTYKSGQRHLDRLLRERPTLNRLEKIAVKTFEPLAKADFEVLLRPSFVSETIEELSIAPFPFANLQGALDREDMKWFQSSRLTSLSLTGLTLEAGRSIGSADDALVGLVGRFPNLRCLEIDRENIQPTTLAKIVSTTQVRTVYHLSGHLFEEVKIWAARKYGAQIVHGYRPSPAQHPDRPLVQQRLVQSLRRPRER